MPVQIPNVTFSEALALFRRFGFREVNHPGGRRRRGKGSHVNLTNGRVNITLTDWGSAPMRAGTLGRQVERAGIDVTAFLWGLGRNNRRGHPAPRGWRPGMPVPEGERDRG